MHDIAIHLSIFVGKDPQAYDFIQQIVRFLLGISLRNADEHQQSLADASSNLGIYFHTSLNHSLNNQAHVCNYYDIVCEGELMTRGRRTEDTTTLRMALVGYEIERNKIEEKIREVQSALGTTGNTAAPVAPKRRKMSAAARRRIGAAQKRRWALKKAGKK